MSVTVGIITRDRPYYLSKCLGSLRTSSSAALILVVDNSSHDKNRQVNKALCKKFNTSYEVCKKKGYSFSRNVLLEKCKTRWLLFLDDDCEVPTAFFGSVKSSLSDCKDMVGINGQVIENLKRNCFTTSSIFLNHFWKLKSEKGNLGALDTKCCLLNVNFLQKEKIAFFTHKIIQELGSEDVDLGKQIVESGGVVGYDQRIQIFHKEPETFFDYFISLVKRCVSNGFVQSTYLKTNTANKFNVRNEVNLFQELKLFLGEEKYIGKKGQFFVLILVLISVILYKTLTSLSTVYFKLVTSLQL